MHGLEFTASSYQISSSFHLIKGMQAGVHASRADSFKVWSTGTTCRGQIKSFIFHICHIRLHRVEVEAPLLTNAREEHQEMAENQGGIDKCIQWEWQGSRDGLRALRVAWQFSKKSRGSLLTPLPGSGLQMKCDKRVFCGLAVERFWSQKVRQQSCCSTRLASKGPAECTGRSQEEHFCHFQAVSLSFRCSGKILSFPYNGLVHLHQIYSSVFHGYLR